MAVNRIALIGLSVLVLSATTTIALAQNKNTSNPLLSGNTVNPVMSGNTVAAGREAPVSPAPSIQSLSTGTNRYILFKFSQFLRGSIVARWSALFLGYAGGRCEHFGKVARPQGIAPAGGCAADR